VKMRSGWIDEAVVMVEEE
jgi:hypothetical protein